MTSASRTAPSRIALEVDAPGRNRPSRAGSRTSTPPDSNSCRSPNAGRCGCGACPTLFHPPSPRPLFPIWRLFRGCLARHSSHTCAARFQPAFASQPPSCAPLPAPKSRFESKLRPAPSPVNLHSTSKLHRAIPGPGHALPGTGGPGKKSEERNQTNRIAARAGPQRGWCGGLQLGEAGKS